MNRTLATFPIIFEDGRTHLPTNSDIAYAGMTVCAAYAFRHPWPSAAEMIAAQKERVARELARDSDEHAAEVAERAQLEAASSWV